MRKKIVLFALLVLPLSIFAQDLKFGHLDRQAMITLMPEFTVAQKSLEDLSLKLKEEMTKLENEFQKDFADFQQNSAILAETIRASREARLQTAYNNIQEFATNAQENLQAEQAKLMSGITEKLNKAVQEVGNENGFIYIFDVQGKNSDPEQTFPSSVLFFSSQSIDVLPLVKKKLNITK